MPLSNRRSRTAEVQSHGDGGPALPACADMGGHCSTCGMRGNAIPQRVLAGTGELEYLRPVLEELEGGHG